MQHLAVQLTIPIPSDAVLIGRVEWEDLKKQELIGVYWSMQDLEKRISRKSEWIKENILYPSRFRIVLDIEHGGFVFYPKLKGQAWSFLAINMADFLDKRFNQIFNQ